MFVTRGKFNYFVIFGTLGGNIIRGFRFYLCIRNIIYHRNFKIIVLCRCHIEVFGLYLCRIRKSYLGNIADNIQRRTAEIKRVFTAVGVYVLGVAVNINLFDFIRPQVYAHRFIRIDAPHYGDLFSVRLFVPIYINSVIGTLFINKFGITHNVVIVRHCRRKRSRLVVDFETAVSTNHTESRFARALSLFLGYRIHNIFIDIRV